MNMKSLPPAVTIPASLFLGAVAGALQADPASVFFSLATAKPAFLGAILAGLVAVVHFYQDPKSPATPPSLQALAVAALRPTNSGEVSQ